MYKIIFFLAFVIIVHCTLIIEDCLSQWSSDIKFTNCSGDSYSSTRSVASSGNFVHVAWNDQCPGNFEIYYKRSTDGGVTWDTNTRLTYNGSMSGQPSIAVYLSNVYVFWYDYRHGTYNPQLYYKFSSDAGVTWGADTRFTNSINYSILPIVTMSGMDVHVVWHDSRDGNYEIYYKRSIGSGLWSSDIRLTNNSSVSKDASIAVFDSVVNVIWYDNRDGNDEIYYKCSSDNGTSWSADTRLTNESHSSNYATVSASDSVVHVSWTDSRDGNTEVYYKRSGDKGLTWGQDTRLTNTSAGSGHPSCGSSGRNTFIVWAEGQTASSEIYYIYSTNWGISWGAVTRLTNWTGVSEYPSLSISGQTVHVVWEDDRDINLEIYYKRNPTGCIGIKSLSSEIPKEYKLEQNYPNPFNPTTNIKFELPKKNYVTLKIFDALGREIAMLVNEKLQTGMYKVTFDAGNLTTGIYFYRLQTESFTDTKRMLMIK